MSEEFDKISERIRTLTTVLESMKARSDPTRNCQEIPNFLHHFVTLLTRGDNNSPREAKATAATGALGNDGTARILIVTQSPYPNSPVSTLNVTQIHKVDKSFHDVVKGPPDPDSLVDHIADIWAALQEYDREAPDHREDYLALRIFEVMRSLNVSPTLTEEDKHWQMDFQL